MHYDTSTCTSLILNYGGMDYGGMDATPVYEYYKSVFQHWVDSVTLTYLKYANLGLSSSISSRRGPTQLHMCMLTPRSLRIE